MKIAHEVAMFDGSIADSVETRLRQRIGKDRMDLWFGGDAKWSQISHNVIGIEVASSFIADCVSKMFRDDLQAAVTEAAGSNFGFQISIASSTQANATQTLAPPHSSKADSVLLTKPIAPQKNTNASPADHVAKAE